MPIQRGRSHTTVVTTVVALFLLSRVTYSPAQSAFSEPAAVPTVEFSQFASLAELSQPRPAPSAPPSAPRTAPRLAGSGLGLGIGAAAATLGMSAGLASSAPFMMGDTSAGGCGGLETSGFLTASIMHPTFACSRLNISENNSPQVRNRIYWNYRHFQDQSEVDVFSYAPQGGRNSLNLDRHTLGFETLLSENISWEFRLPINTQLDSTLNFTQFGRGATGSDQLGTTSLPLNDYTTELGNLSTLLKACLYANDTIYFSAGLAVNVPTAKTVRINGNVDDTNFQIFTVPTPTMPSVLVGSADVKLQLQGIIRNQTVNLSPFLAFLHTPNDRWFNQGFLQFDAPLNKSAASLSMDLRATLFDGAFSFGRRLDVAGSIAQQTLMRLNLGTGYWLYKDMSASWLRAIGAMFEFHYTTTLNDADLLGPLTVVRGIDEFQLDATQLTVGNLANRVDVTNVAIGVPLIFRNLTVTNGFVLPLLDAPNRGFSLEYNLMVNRVF